MEITITQRRAEQACEAPEHVHRAIGLECPRCGLRVSHRAPWMQMQICPRCIAHARITVRLVSPAADHAERAGVMLGTPVPS